ncbi:MAG: hypothetical protein WC121_00885 [Candidatus Kapaibacterium sp.]
MQRNRIIKSIILFVLSISVLLIVKTFIINLSNSYLTSVSNLFLQEYVNEQYIFEKDALAYMENETYLNVDCIFYGTEKGDIQRNVKMNTFLEFLLPLFILISFSIATCFYFKSKWLFIGFSLLGGIYLFTIKILVMIFDNYNYNDFKLSEFIFPIDQIIYFLNFVLNTTGSSINFVLPILIILIQFSIFTHKENLIIINQ